MVLLLALLGLREEEEEEECVCFFPCGSDQEGSCLKEEGCVWWWKKTD